MGAFSSELHGCSVLLLLYSHPHPVRLTVSALGTSSAAGMAAHAFTKGQADKACRMPPRAECRRRCLALWDHKYVGRTC